MTGGSERVAGTEPLTIRQLEDRLQLAMAVREHLTNQRSVSRNDMRVAMESLEAELPANAPLNSFTVEPSQVQYMTAMDFIRAEEAALNDRLLKRVKVELTYTLREISILIHKSKVPWEYRRSTLQVVGKYLSYGSFVLPDQHDDEAIQKELSVIHETMEQWQAQKQLGQDVLTENNLYQQAYALWERVARALAEQLQQPDHDDAILIEDINVLTAALRQASHVEQEEVWTPTALCNCTAAFMATFDGPIPYKLQPAEGVEAVMRKIETLDDIRTLQDMLLLAQAIHMYLVWCWKLDNIRTVAVDCAITICRQGGLVRSMMAA